MLAIKTFGSVRIEQDDEGLEMPASRKTRALLAYLVISNVPQRRDRLCELFWEVPDDPRGALRWSLTKLRPVLNAGGRQRLLADRERVQIDTSAIDVDFHELRHLAESDHTDHAKLAEAWEHASHGLLEDCELSNQPEFAIWLDQQRNEAARHRIKLARRLALSPDLSPEDADKWAERWLREAPFDPLAAQHAVFSRRRLGNMQGAAELADELENSFREAGLDPPVWPNTPSFTADALFPSEENEGPPRQAIRFVEAEDGTSLSWASVGRTENPPLVKAANWLSHLELDWDAPIWSPLFRDLARSYHFIRYDERGCGLSDWDVPEISFESFVTDLELVADAAGIDRFPLLGISQGAAVSIEFAARHPERVSHLILFGGYAAGWRHTGDADEIREREAVMVLTETGWGRANPAYRHLFSQSFMPDATADELRWFDEFQRRTTSPENAVRFLDAFAGIDVRERLKDIRAPTLVVHSRNDMRVPVESALALAGQIPDAQFTGVDSRNHLLLGREPASSEFVSAVRDFLRS